MQSRHTGTCHQFGLKGDALHALRARKDGCRQAPPVGWTTLWWPAPHNPCTWRLATRPTYSVRFGRKRSRPPTSLFHSRHPPLAQRFVKLVRTCPPPFRESRGRNWNPEGRERFKSSEEQRSGAIGLGASILTDETKERGGVPEPIPPPRPPDVPPNPADPIPDPPKPPDPDVPPGIPPEPVRQRVQVSCSAIVTPGLAVP